MFGWSVYIMSYQINLVISTAKFFRVASLALGQSYDCPSACEVILKDMGKNHDEA